MFLFWIKRKENAFIRARLIRLCMARGSLERRESIVDLSRVPNRRARWRQVFLERSRPLKSRGQLANTFLSRPGEPSVTWKLCDYLLLFLSLNALAANYYRNHFANVNVCNSILTLFVLYLITFCFFPYRKD